VDGLKFFHQLIIILGFSIPVIYIFNKIKLPSIIGFLITGIIIGPFGLKLIDDIGGIQLMADIGVAFLLFTIGIEIRLSRFLKNLSILSLPPDLNSVADLLENIFLSPVFGTIRIKDLTIGGTSASSFPSAGYCWPLPLNIFYYLRIKACSSYFHRLSKASLRE